MNTNVHFHLTTGRPSEVVGPLRRRLSGYTRQDRVRRFKIGITNDPRTRFFKGYANDYDEMIVLYESPSINSVSQVERELIDHNFDFARNRIAGGGGNYGQPPYYLYVVLRAR